MHQLTLSHCLHIVNDVISNMNISPHRCSAVSEASVVACCFSPCGQMFATGCTRGDLKLWDVDSSLLHAEKDAHDLGITCCNFAPQFKVGECSVHTNQHIFISHVQTCRQFGFWGFKMPTSGKFCCYKEYIGEWKFIHDVGCVKIIPFCTL